jgi:hypothetical protein
MLALTPRDISAMTRGRKDCDDLMLELARISEKTPPSPGNDRVIGRHLNLLRDSADQATSIRSKSSRLAVTSADARQRDAAAERS